MVYLRKAIQEDIDLLYRWANDPVVRENSFNVEPIPYETHRNWFNRIMKDENTAQFIMMDEETPVGQIRLSIDEDTAEIGYSIDPGFRGRGYGRTIIQLINEKVKTEYPGIKKLVAKVKPANIASKDIFEKEGYEIDHICYVLSC